MAAPAVKSFTQAVLSDTGTVTAPAGTSIGDLVICVVWSQFTTTATTHTIQSGYTAISTVSLNDGTTCGRLSAACKVATVAGAQSYVPYTIANATTGQTAVGLLTITGADTTAPASWISATTTNTGNQAPDPPSITGLNGDALVLAIAGWQVTTAGATTTTQPTNYTEQIDGPAGTHVTHLAVANRVLTGLSSSTEDPGQFADNVTPNSSAAMSIAVPYVVPTPSLSTLSPSGVSAGGAAFTLTVNGSNFINGSVVRWNGANRTTTFVSATQLTAAITAADIDTVASTASVTVQNSGIGSNTLSFTITPPSLSTLSPSAAVAGGTLFTLTVNGANFLSGSFVRWNGADRTTAFVSTTQLTAQIPTTDLSAAGSASVTVRNQSVVSNALTFTIASSQVNTRQRRSSVIGLDGIYRMVLPAPNTAVTGWDRCVLAGKYIGFTADGAVSALQFRNRTDSRFRLSPSFPC